MKASKKSKTTAMLLAFFLGTFGVHRFYVKRIVSGIFMIMTLGGFGFWALIDFIVIACGEFKDNDGRKLTK